MSQSYVLVVDPNPATARRVEEVLRGTGFGLLVARDATEAVAAAEGMDLSVVLACASLPRGNGYELARQLREAHPAVAVFLLAGGFDVYNEQRAQEAGVTGQIRRPFTPAGLSAHLEQVLGPLGEADLPSADDAISPLDELDAAAVEPLVQTVPVSMAPAAGRGPRPPASDERIATFLPRDYQELEPVAVDPEVIGPALERAILEVLPEVVQRVLRHSLTSSPAFRDLVEVAVEDAVRAQLPGIAERVVQERLREREQRDDAAD